MSFDKKTKLDPQWRIYSSRISFSGACLRRRSRCHEFPPSRSILSASFRSRQPKIHRSQVGLHGSEPGLPWTTNPPSPIVRWAKSPKWRTIWSRSRVLSIISLLLTYGQLQVVVMDSKQSNQSIMTRSDQPEPPAVAIVRQNGLSSASSRALQ